MLKNILIVFMGLCFLEGGIMAVDSPDSLNPMKPLTVYVGAYVFPDPVYDSLALVEIPFSLDRNDFEFYRPYETDSSLYARIFAQINLINTYGKTVDSASTFFSVRVPTRTEAMRAGIRLFNKIDIFVRPGVYSARMIVIDAVNKQSGSAFIDKIIVEPTQKGHITIGGPELAYKITAVKDSLESNMRLVKNGFKIIPNPISIFSTTDTAINLYGELYNLKLDDSNKVRLTLVALQNDSVYRWLSRQVVDKPGSTAVFTESFDITGWPSGLYKLMLTAEDLTDGDTDTNLTPFRIISPQDVLVAVRNYKEPDPYDRLTINEQVQLVMYFITPQQKATLNRLNPEGKRNFLEQYWKEHNNIASIGNKPTRAELIKRFRYANRFFSTNEAKNNGWSTDRGRIFITYGPWEEIEKREMPRLRRPFEVWYYYSIKEGKYFVFEAQRDTEEYRLVHSNVYGEVFNRQWDRIIKSGIIDIEPDQVPETSSP